MESARSGAVVSSFDEWSPLEEVIVGIAEGARVPPRPSPLNNAFNMSRLTASQAGQPFPFEAMMRIVHQLENFVHVLEAEGVKVRRPDPIDLASPVTTPFFREPCGYNLMNARDLCLIIGDEIIEVPSAARERYFEQLAYRSLFKEYFRAGARWTAAPRPALSDELFTTEFLRRDDDRMHVTTEFEPVFDAADFVRCGHDLFFQRGERTNYFGVEWLRRHLGPAFRFHEVKTRCKRPVHIDTTFVPIGPGRVLVNPDWIGELPLICKTWEVIEAPEPQGSSDVIFGFARPTSRWIAMNVFLIDEKRIVVEAAQTHLMRMLKDRGYTPIPVPFTDPPLLGGAFHCCTLDVRRRGGG